MNGMHVLQLAKRAQLRPGVAQLIVCAMLTCAVCHAQITPPSGTPQGAVDSKKNTAPPNTPPDTGEATASTTKLKLGPLDPSVPPAHLPTGRPVIGLALGGGAALSLTDIGVIRWLEEHHIPVDVLAGTSMGSIIGALYSTGHTPDEMEHVLTEDSVTSVFRIQQAYKAQSFRRREDDRDVPNAVTIGLRHGISFRNSLLTDTGLNELLTREFLRYNDQLDFNNLPVPFRCVATDLNDAKSVTFARGSLPDAVRASASLPGVFRPVALNGHEYVDGAILKNLPTPDVLAMRADVVIAVSIPLQPVTKGDLDSIIGVLQRAFQVGIANNENYERTLANVVIIPNVDGFTGNDYLKTVPLAQRGYEAAEANKAALLKYAVSDAQWQQYLAQRRARQRGPVSTVLRVKVDAPDPGVRHEAERLFQPLVDRPIDTDAVEKQLAMLRSDGRYNADYTVGYDTAVPSESDRPILLVHVTDKRNGPPFLDVGLNIAAQTGGVTRATVNTILLQQDLGGYGSELRTKVDVGFLTFAESEYYRKLDDSGYFIAPRLDLTRQPFYIYSGETRLSERQLQQAGGGADIGWSDGRDQELRLGVDDRFTTWNVTTGTDPLPDYSNNSQFARLKYTYDSQDRALVPRFGVRSTSTFGYLYGTPGSPHAFKFTTQISFAQTLDRKNTFLMNMEGGTLFNTAVAQPFRFTLGGPLRLAASAIDQYRGTDYFLVTPGYLRQIHSLPAPLGNNLYLGGTFEAGQMLAPDAPTINRWDVYIGLVAETPLGVISVAPAFGNAGERKLTFTIGKLF